MMVLKTDASIRAMVPSLELPNTSILLSGDRALIFSELTAGLRTDRRLLSTDCKLRKLRVKVQEEIDALLPEQTANLSHEICAISTERIARFPE
jgi:hypothetical protein